MPRRLSEHPVHLGLGATAISEPKFTGMNWYPDYGARHASDGKEGRLVSMHRFSAPWDVWEMHPEGGELVVCTHASVLARMDPSALVKTDPPARRSFVSRRL